MEEDLGCPSLHYFEDMRVKPPTFRRLAGQLSLMKEPKVPGEIRTHTCELQAILIYLVNNNIHSKIPKTNRVKLQD